MQEITHYLNPVKRHPPPTVLQTDTNGILGKVDFIFFNPRYGPYLKQNIQDVRREL